MNRRAHHAQIGQWYLRRDLGETFQVTGYDDRARTIEIQTTDGDLDEIEGELWRELPLELIEPPEHWSGPVDDIQSDDDHGDTKSGTDGVAPSELLTAMEEVWEDSMAEEEIDSYAEPLVPGNVH